MSYNPSALAAAMNRSLKFENIPFNGTITILKLELNSEYKIHLKIGDNIIDCDILGDKIIRVNSNLGNQEGNSKFELALVRADDKLLFSIKKTEVFSSSILNLEIEYSFDNFEVLNTPYTGTEFTSYEFGKQIYSNLRTDNLVTTGSLSMGILDLSNSGEIKAGSIKIGNWVISKSATDNEIKVSITGTTS